MRQCDILLTKGSDPLNLIILWIILAVVFLVVELVTVGMVSLWFMVGALVALLAAALGANPWLQILLFLLVSIACFALLYPKLKGFVGRNRHPTNADMVLGKTCIVTQRIDNIADTGAVSVGGKVWSARTANGATAEEGSLVRADDIEGVKLIVSPLPDTEE